MTGEAHMKLKPRNLESKPPMSQNLENIPLTQDVLYLQVMRAAGWSMGKELHP